MAFWRKDLIAVNGYNENFTGWGDEDSELTLRLMNAGKKELYLKFAGIIYHIYHKESSSKSQSSKNRDLLQETLLNKVSKCSLGIDQYTNKNNGH
jgi:predicted glycosyltransferase involved in capsule biosynthesis